MGADIVFAVNKDQDLGKHEDLHRERLREHMSTLALREQWDGKSTGQLEGHPWGHIGGWEGLACPAQDLGV